MSNKQLSLAQFPLLLILLGTVQILETFGRQILSKTFSKSLREREKLEHNSTAILENKNLPPPPPSIHSRTIKTAQEHTQ